MGVAEKYRAIGVRAVRDSLITDFLPFLLLDAKLNQFNPADEEEKELVRAALNAAPAVRNKMALLHSKIEKLIPFTS